MRLHFFNYSVLIRLAIFERNHAYVLKNNYWLSHDFGENSLVCNVQVVKIYKKNRVVRLTYQNTIAQGDHEHNIL